MKCGAPTRSVDVNDARWQKYLCQHFCALVDLNPSDILRRAPASQRKPRMNWLLVTSIEVLACINDLGCNKANGPNGSSSGKAGHGAFPVKLGPRYHARRSDGYTVLAWRGGRHVELWKSRKSVRECSSYRGLLVADALGKSSVKSAHCAWQHGGAKGGGTDLAHLILSTFALFVDLERAFDMIGREIVLGWLADPSLVNISKDGKVQHLISIGIGPEGAEKITTLIMEPRTVCRHRSGKTTRMQVWRCDLRCGV